MSNEQKKTAVTSKELKKNDCFTDRKNVNSLIKTEGEIFKIDHANFGIRFKEESKAPLAPCNLPPQLQQEGLTIIFSGEVKETRLEELWAAQPFVLTEISEK